jgi:hypothetical protein
MQAVERIRAVWIIGGGKFGRRAAETIGGADSVADILIVEKDPSRCRTLKNRGLHVVEADGIAFLKSRLGGPLQTQWIVAAAPIHVAYEWVRACLSDRVRIEPAAMPAGITGLLPNAVPGAQGQWYATNADFICPPDCTESGRICSFTGRKRPRSMHAFIRSLPAPGVKILVVRSYQLAAGVGGLRPHDLLQTLCQIESSQTPVLLATACKCHAVLNSFKIISID